MECPARTREYLGGAYEGAWSAAVSPGACLPISRARRRRIWRWIRKGPSNLLPVRHVRTARSLSGDEMACWWGGEKSCTGEAGPRRHSGSESIRPGLWQQPERLPQCRASHEEQLMRSLAPRPRSGDAAKRATTLLVPAMLAPAPPAPRREHIVTSLRTQGGAKTLGELGDSSVGSFHDFCVYD